jgi:hypothetical protein
MNLHVKLISAHLSHDTDLITTMVREAIDRILIASYSWVQNAIDQRHEETEVKSLFGIKNSFLIRVTIY